MSEPRQNQAEVFVKDLKRINDQKPFGAAVLEALGIDTKNVIGFTMVCNAGEMPAISVTSVDPSGLGVAAAQVLRKYRIEPLESVNLPAVDESTSLESLIRTTHRLSDSPESDRT